jgi:hypothetical protein
VIRVKQLEFWAMKDVRSSLLSFPLHSRRSIRASRHILPLLLIAAFVGPLSIQAYAADAVLYPVPTEHGWGYISSSGTLVVDGEFASAQGFVEGMGMVSDGKKIGFVDSTGKLVIPCRFDDADAFSSGLAAVKVKGLWGYIDRSGKFAIPPQFAEEPWPFHDGFAHSGIGRLGPNMQRDFLIRADGTRFIPAGADDMTGYRDGVTWAGRFVTNRAARTATEYWTILDGTQTPRSRPLPFCLVPGSFSEGLAAVRPGECTGETKYGYIDHEGKMEIEAKFDFAGDFHGGIARVLTGKTWGFIRKNGSYLVEPSLSFASDFNSGLAAAAIGDQYGFIDTSGNWAIKPCFPVNVTLIVGFDGELAMIFLPPATGSQVPRIEYINKSGRVVYPATPLRLIEAPSRPD